MPLFKYVSAGGVKILQNLSIRFRAPSDFNDPFECLPDTRLLDDPQQVEDIFQKTTAAFKTARPDLAATFSEEEARATFAVHYPARAAEGKLLLLRRLKDATKDFRVLCLSGVPPDDPRALLMWGHYCESDKGHDGFVLEFDERHPWIKSHAFKSGEQHDSGIVRYSAARASYKDIRPGDGIIFTKSIHWKYEEEYRLVRMVGDPELDATIIDSLAKIPPAMLLRVFLGANTSSSTETAIRSALTSRPELKHVTLFKAGLHVDEFKLVMERA